ncbi:MAG: PilZ domain-containing protein [Archangium sp.]|nr:PilZ domain-containing protein [Archangium sp.]
MASGGSERRADPRFAAHFDVRFSKATDAAKAFNAFSINFSSGGLCVKSSGSYELGESLSLSLTIEGEIFELEGVVAWMRGEAIGVRFVNVRTDTRARLESVARILATKGPALSWVR